MLNRSKVLLPLLAVLLLLAAACRQQTTDTTAGALGEVTIAAGEPIKIATIQVISGASASLGTDQVRGIEIAIGDKGGEILGHEIELQIEDGQCLADGGTTAAQKIVADPQVVGIVGTSCSGEAVPASQIMSEAGFIMISGSNTSPRLTTSDNQAKGDAWQDGYFRTAHNDLVQGAAAAAYAFEELNFTRAATIHDGDPYTEGLANAFGASFQELGGEVVEATAVNKGDTDMKPVLTEVAAANPQIIFFPIFQPEGDFIAKQAKEVGGLTNVVLMGADGLLSDTYVTIAETKGVYFSGPGVPEGADYNAFVAKYEQKYGEKPIQAFHAHAYDAFNMLVAAIEAVAEQDGDTVTIDRQALRDEVYGTTDFTGLTGELTCNEFGDCGDPRIQVFRNTEATADITAVKANILYTFDPDAQ